jgi:hypothetical protein
MQHSDANRKNAFYPEASSCAGAAGPQQIRERFSRRAIMGLLPGFSNVERDDIFWIFAMKTAIAPAAFAHEIHAKRQKAVLGPKAPAVFCRKYRSCHD